MHGLVSVKNSQNSTVPPNRSFAKSTPDPALCSALVYGLVYRGPNDNLGVSSVLCFTCKCYKKKRADERTRTADLLITSELLYLLSYVGLLRTQSISQPAYPLQFGVVCGMTLPCLRDPTG